MKIILSLFLVMLFSIAGCAQTTSTKDSSTRQDISQTTDVVDPKRSSAAAIDPKLARELSDDIIKALIEERYQDVNARMSSQYKHKATAEELKIGYSKSFLIFGKPLEAEYKLDEASMQNINGQERPIRTFYYRVKTSKNDNQIRFINLNIGLEGNSLVCTFFAPTSYGDKAPIQLQ